ncbi:FliH/SctL family protein [Oceanirhabdus sp. W0125-5]|uniref:FliH/SctL family protein n=1 Tax=Oceanirhabdus sp. W0125-5 TaxID=2999116 RepID=UPI0022F2BDC8|nr:hypothetical protein [Oceanirhabdus sp. W0125-5]WBW95429.1 hypothetical protein OW730_17260 [Oceanirhabdus sp. W0125-5]
MQSSSRVLKKQSINNTGAAVIKTNSAMSPMNDRNERNLYANIKDMSAVGYSSAIIEESHREALKIKNKAYNDAVKIEEKAFNKGYSAGAEKGYSDGYNEGYNQAIAEINQKEAEILSNALRILEDAKNFKKEYINQTEEEIKNLVYNSITDILKSLIPYGDAFEGIIKSHLKKLKKEEEIIIYTNGAYYEYLSMNIGQWLEIINSKSDVSIVIDEELELGKMVIEKSKGKINIDIDKATNEIKDAIFSE